MESNVSIVIANYNSRDTLDECLLNISKLKNIDDTIVVDNASADNSALMVKKKYPWVNLISLKENKGIAYSYNLGIKKTNSRYILFLGSDAFPNDKTIEGLSNYLDKNSKTGIVVPKLITRSGEIDMDGHRGFPTPWVSFTHFSKLDKLFPKSKLFSGYFLGSLDIESLHEIDLCISHFMLVRRDTIKKVGLFDEDFFVFGEDVDFCYRVKEGGWKIVYSPKYSAIHYKGVSIGTRKETKDISKASIETKKKMITQSTRAMNLFYKKHYMNKYPKIVNYPILFAIKVLGKIRSARI